ncbi:MAG: MerR family transcriptional regulator [Rhodospirillales bacterium]|nr:MerR family transcriptional regulator [Rhodospirillales bacterium]
MAETGSPRPAGKSAAAFRTIAEVAAELELPAHVLRFWESKFPQIKPLKRRGGRRYYRPEDVALLRRIRSLLHTEGYTIKGVQRLLRESGGRVPLPPAEAAGDNQASATPSPATFVEQPAPSDSRNSLRALLTELEALRSLLRDQGY